MPLRLLILMGFLRPQQPVTDGSRSIASVLGGAF